MDTAGISKCGFTDKFIDGIFRLSSDLIAVFDPAGKALRLGDRWKHQLGYGETDLHQTSLVEMCHPVSREILIRSMERMKTTGGGSTQFDCDLLAANGKGLPVRLTLSSLAGDQCRGILAMAMPMDSLRMQGDLFEVMQRSGAIGSWQIRVPTFQMTLSSECQRQMGSHGVRETTTVLEWLESFCDSHRETLAAAIEMTLMTGSSFDLECNTLEVETGAKAKRIRVRGFLNFNGNQPTMISGTCQDITELYEFKLAADIEREAAVQNAQMVELGQVAMSIAHEINNPLGIISATVEQLKSLAELGEADASGVMASSELIQNTTFRIAKIVKSLGAFARQSQDDPFEWVTFSHLLSDAQTLCSGRLKKERIELQMDCDSATTIQCRPAQICHVLLNVLNNAITTASNFSPLVDSADPLPSGDDQRVRPPGFHSNESRWVRLELRGSESFLTLKVLTSAKRVSPEIRGQILDRYYTAKTKTGGTGFGLALSNQIARAHGGSIELIEENGSPHFCLKLPRTQSPSAIREAA